MKTSSAKAKGRRLLSEVRDILIKRFSFHPDDITVTPSGVTGEDLQLARCVKEVLPLCFEGKNQQSMNVWESLKQAESHVKDSRKPVLVFKRNHSEIYIALKFNDFLDLIQKQQYTEEAPKQ